MEHDDLATLTGAEVLGRDGVALGRVEDIYFDRGSDRPVWVTVPGDPRPKAVPLEAASFDEQGRLVVPYDEATVAGAPDADIGAGRIREEREADLAAHYGVAYPTEGDATAIPGVATAGQDEEHPGGAQV